MIQLLVACRNILGQLRDVLAQIDGEDFRRPSATLSQATLGQHFRHTLEFFSCLEQGFVSGIINYDKRNHDRLIETDKFIALLTIDRIMKFLDGHHEERPLLLEVAYERDAEKWITIPTNYRRELVYNIEHAVHHMAIMKIGIREIAAHIQLPEDFGVAVSTLRFKESQAVSVG